MEKEFNKFLKEIKGDVWTNDPDDSMIAREFYSEFWSEILDKKIGCYRGETILSFNTIAGCMIRLLSIYREKGFSMPECGEKRLELILSSNEISMELKEKFSKFYRVYHTLANFMIFIKPNNKYYKIEDNPNLQYVKNRDYHEFPDLLLKDIYLFYKTGGEKCNTMFFKDTNLGYFKSYGNGMSGWIKYVKENYLQDFFEDYEEYSTLIKLAPADDVKLPYNQKKASELFDKVEESKKCVQEIDKFLSNAVIIIERRAVTLDKYLKR